MPPSRHRPSQPSFPRVTQVRPPTGLVFLAIPHPFLFISHFPLLIHLPPHHTLHRLSRHTPHRPAPTAPSPSTNHYAKQFFLKKTCFTTYQFKELRAPLPPSRLHHSQRPPPPQSDPGKATHWLSGPGYLRTTLSFSLTFAVTYSRFDFLSL